MADQTSLGIVIHAPKDLRIEPVPAVAPGPGAGRVAIEAGGICGSDMHYFNHGGFGTVRIKEPMVLGHEIAGRVVEVGAGVTSVAPGTRVAVNPSRPCGHCRYCREGMRNECVDMHLIGSATPRSPEGLIGLTKAARFVEEGQTSPFGEQLVFEGPLRFPMLQVTLDTSYHRLLCHSLCSYYRLVSESVGPDDARVTQIRFGKPLDRLRDNWYPDMPERSMAVRLVNVK